MSGRSAGREAWRRRLLLLGTVPALAAAGFAVEVAVVLHHDAQGRAALEDGEPARAAESYAANRSLNLLEPWVAPYDEATARFRAGDPAGAVRGYADALPLAPAARECRVRTDLALAHGAVAALATTADDPGSARRALARGVAALADCPSTDDRAADVLSTLQDDQAASDGTDEQAGSPDGPPDGPPQGPPDDSPGQGEAAGQQQELGERNDRGREKRQRAEDRADGTGLARGPGQGDPGPGPTGPPAYSW